MEKTMKARVQHKHDVEANWLKATNFTPLASEIIVYDPDENYDYPRIKIGDGKTNINSLPFVTKDYAKISDIPTKPEDIGALPDSTVIPTVPTKISAFENDKGYLTQHQSLDAYAKTADLGALATKDSLTASDVGALPNTTKIPSALSDLTEDSTHRTVTDTEKNAWNAKSNFSGNYADLNGKPAIPTMPTKISAFENDAGYLTEHQSLEGLATEEWVEEKFEEHSGGNVDLTGYATEQYVKDYAQPKGDYALRSEIPSVPVKSVNGKTGAVSLTATDVKARPDSWMPTASDVGALPSSTVIPTVPTKVSEFTNDAGYLTEHQDLSEYAKKTEIPSVPVKSVNGKTGAVSLIASDVKARPDTWMPSASDVGALPSSTVIPTVPTKLSAFTNDSGFITGYTETDPTVPAWAKAASKPSYSKSEVGLGNVDNVKQYSASNPPPYPVTSVNGKTGAVTITVPTVPTKVSAFENDKGYLTQHQDISHKLDANKLPEAVNDALAQAKASGEFDGEPGQPGAPGKTPVVGVDYYTDADKAEFESYIATELAKRGQLKPEFAESIEWLEANGEQDKLYVLNDKADPNYGMIYAWMLTEKEVTTGPSYTNLLPLAINADGTPYVGDNGEKGYRVGYRYSASSGAEKAATGYDVLGFIPAKAGDIIRIKNVTQVTTSNDGSGYAVAYFFTSAFAKTTGLISISGKEGLCEYVDGVHTFTVPNYNTIAYFKVTLKGVSANTIVTVNEEITEGGGTEIGTEYAWTSTGLAFVPADYEPRIINLEKKTAQNTADISALKKGSTTATSIKTWDAPIYDANIPVFTLSTEKAAITEAEKTVSGVYAKYDALMAKHQNYITKTNLGMCSDGVTPVYRYDFREPEPHRGTTGKKEWSETKAKAIIVSGIHWEWGGIFALYNALEELADNPELFHLRRNTHLIVLPVCNPYAVANMSVRNANLVEIHRNFEVDFIYPGESGYIELGERSHGGTEPLSEVETQYIDNIMKANTDAAFFLTCHSNQSDTVYGTGFTWASPATYYMCNMHYRLVDKLSDVWMKKYGNELAAGMADYRTENTPEWDNRLGSAYLSTTNGTETKQATKYGIQATNIEVTDAFLVHGTKANPEPALSSFTMSRGAEVYANFLLTAFGVYDSKDKKEYLPTEV